MKVLLTNGPGLYTLTDFPGAPIGPVNYFLHLLSAALFDRGGRGRGYNYHYMCLLLPFHKTMMS